MAWVGYVNRANDLHPYVECSNKGDCDRNTGTCKCYSNYEGIACERTACAGECNGAGVCYSQKQIAIEAGAVYNTPWDANKQA